MTRLRKGQEMATVIPRKGEQYTFSYLRNYHPNVSCRSPWNEVPFEKGCGCADRRHAYYSEEFTEKVAEVIYWMDNSVEVVGENGHRATVVAPHGDLCY